MNSQQLRNIIEDIPYTSMVREGALYMVSDGSGSRPRFATANKNLLNRDSPAYKQLLEDLKTIKPEWTEVTGYEGLVVLDGVDK